MASTTEFSVADADFYMRPTDVALGRPYAPTRGLDGWRRTDRGGWTLWVPADGQLAAQGWKVHVSARLDRADAVLDVVAEVCARHDVAFKHLSSDWLFRWLHHKHGDRMQSGKFCAAYPSSVAAAEALMVDLADALQDEQGPRPLTDRSFRGSRVVSYRYGAFLERRRLRPDGTSASTLVDGNGREVEDVRRAGFTLPEGVTDPFIARTVARPTTDGPGATAGPRLGGYTFTRVVTTANAGATYVATSDAGREVFVKQARPHNGYHWDGSCSTSRLRHEYDVLVGLHTACPGIAPEPVDYLCHDGHEYLVTELVPGRTLWAWNALFNPLAQTDTRPEVVTAHYDRCRRLLDRLASQLDRLHAAGYVFVDLNPGNVLVDGEDRPRLVDFEAAGRYDEPLSVQGAPGYVPPWALQPDAVTHDRRELDDYGLAAVTQLLIHPSHAVLDRNPGAVAHLRADLPLVPCDLWRRATRLRSRAEPRPTPEEVADDPAHWLRWLRDRTAEGLLRQVDPGAERPVRTVPEGLVVHPAGLAHGTAGVVHVLHLCGLPVDPRLVDGLSRSLRTGRADLPPGLMTGSAGLSWALAEQGRVDDARRAVFDAAEHPLLEDEVTLSDGRAGVALAALHLDLVDPDDRLVDLAHRLLLPALQPGGQAHLGSGWRRGGAGVALAVHRLRQRLGDPALTATSELALRADLRHLRPAPNGAALFHVSDRDHRLEPYVAAGSAGFALVATRVLTGADPAPDLHAAWHASISAVRGSLHAIAPSLFEGLAGLGLTLAEIDALRPDLGLGPDAERLARGLFKHVVPGPHHPVCFLAGKHGRISDDLAHGSAGIVLFLDQLLNRRVGGLLTLDPRPREPARVPPTSRRPPDETTSTPDTPASLERNDR